MLLLEHVSVPIAFLCLGLSSAAQWTAIAAFNRRRIPIAWFVVGLAVWAAVSFGPTGSWDFGLKAFVYLLLPTAYVGHCCWELWQRTERLPARWPLLALMLVDFAVTALAAAAFVPMQSLPETAAGGTFLPVYLAMMIYFIGSAVFVMALVKERSVAEQTSAANTDGLTGLSNRGALLAAGAAMLARTLNHGAPISAIMFDLDKFKLVNDNFGHQTGDLVLKRFAETTLSVLRSNDLIGRIGGEEFLALIPSVSQEAAVAIADRIRRTFAESAEWVDGNPVKATVSAGIAIALPTDRLETLHDLIDRADRALYAAKEAGRNRIATDGDPSAPAATNIVRLA